MADIRSEIEKRRTFAIISHPDAGKTTLTEKFLLLERNGGRSGQRRLLLRQRRALLQKIHTNQQRIDCLDFLLHSIEEKKQGSTGRKAR